MLAWIGMTSTGCSTDAPWCIRVTTGHSDFGFVSSSALAKVILSEEHSM